MLRDLNLNEMEIVSGGHYHEDPTPNLFGGGYQHSASDLLGPDAGWIQGGGGGSGNGGTTTFSEVVFHGSTGGILPDTSGQGFDATVGQPSTYGLPDPSKKNPFLMMMIYVIYCKPSMPQ